MILICHWHTQTHTHAHTHTDPNHILHMQTMSMFGPKHAPNHILWSLNITFLPVSTRTFSTPNKNVMIVMIRVIASTIIRIHPLDLSTKRSSTVNCARSCRKVIAHLNSTTLTSTHRRQQHSSRARASIDERAHTTSACVCVSACVCAICERQTNHVSRRTVWLFRHFDSFAVFVSRATYIHEQTCSRICIRSNPFSHMCCCINYDF